MNADKKSSTPIIKAAFFVVFILAAVLVFRFTPLKEYLHPQSLKDLFAASGNLAPLFFVFVYAIGVCLFLPATLFTGIGAMLFGTLFGFLYNITGAMLGASAAFFIGRYLGRDFAASLIGDRLAKYDRKIADNGFAVTLYLRLLFFPTFFFATITEVWSSGQWEKLWSWKSLLSLILFISSFFIPQVVKHFKPEI
jgi:uncharacterized membrane protein YdjX (TVP38/TMEM64 family)